MSESTKGLYPGWEKRPENLTASDALDQLRSGNLRYHQERTVHPHADRDRRIELVDAQHPFATILTCADSRVPPELIFDQGLGDLFVVRVAGNICDDAVLGTIEYASLHLGVNLVVVMGHQKCGAVNAAVANRDFDGPATNSHIDALIQAIRPAVTNAPSQNSDDLLEASIRENAAMVARQIRQADPILDKLANHGTVVQPAYYNLQSGQVEWLSAD